MESTPAANTRSQARGRRDSSLEGVDREVVDRAAHPLPLQSAEDGASDVDGDEATRRLLPNVSRNAASAGSMEGDTETRSPAGNAAQPAAMPPMDALVQMMAQMQATLAASTAAMDRMNTRSGAVENLAALLDRVERARVAVPTAAMVSRQPPPPRCTHAESACAYREISPSSLFEADFQSLRVAPRDREEVAAYATSGVVNAQLAIQLQYAAVDLLQSRGAFPTRRHATPTLGAPLPTSSAPMLLPAPFLSAAANPLPSRQASPSRRYAAPTFGTLPPNSSSPVQPPYDTRTAVGDADLLVWSPADRDTLLKASSRPDSRRPRASKFVHSSQMQSCF